MTSMYLSARERLILNKLLKEKEMTVQALAEHLGVSTRTIHRDLKGIEGLLEKKSLRLIKKSGIGLQLVGDELAIEQLTLEMQNVESDEYTPEERQRMILCALLNSSEPIKLISLAQDLYVTVATISNDLTRIEERLVHSSLDLVRKRGFGIQLVGSESAKRRMMSQLISEHVEEVELLKLIKRHDSFISEQLLGLVDQEKVSAVERVVEDFIQNLPYSISDRAYVGLVIHIALAMERIIQGEHVQVDDALFHHLKEAKEFEYATHLAHQLSQTFQVEVPEAEIGYMAMHLQGAKLRNEQEFILEDSTMEIALKVKELIQLVEEKTQFPLSKDESLFQGLVVHLKPALYRIKQEMGITNPLLDQIKEDYEELFFVVKEAAKQTFNQINIPDEEVGYLVLHFGSAFVSNQMLHPIRALVICSSGIGTSKMLLSRMKREIPEITELKNVSMFELSNMDITRYDLIISTISLPQINREHIVVSPILTKDEIKKIKRSIRHCWQQPLVENERENKTIPSNTQGVGKTMERIQTMKVYSDTVYRLLQEIELLEVEAKTINDALVNICESLHKKEVLSDIDEVVKALVKREKLGGLGIPNTSLALFHTRSHSVQKACFSIANLSNALRVKGMDDSEVEIRKILFMIAPTETSSEVLEVLSYISACMIESKESISLFETGDVSAIKAYMAVKFEQFLQEKLNS